MIDGFAALIDIKMEYSAEQKILEFAVDGHLVLAVLLHGLRFLGHSRLFFVLFEDVVGAPQVQGMLFVFEARHGRGVAADVVLQPRPIVRQLLHLVLLLARVQLHDVFGQAGHVLQVGVALDLRLQLCQLLLLRVQSFPDLREEVLDVQVLRRDCLGKVLGEMVGLELVGVPGRVQLLPGGLVQLEDLRLQLVLLLVQDDQVVSDLLGRAGVYFLDAVGVLRAGRLLVLDDVVVQLLVEGFLCLILVLRLSRLLVRLGLRSWRFLGVRDVLLAVFLGKWS